LITLQARLRSSAARGVWRCFPRGCHAEIPHSADELEPFNRIRYGQIAS
jgi:hypothetical protein